MSDARGSPNAAELRALAVNSSEGLKGITRDLKYGAQGMDRTVDIAIAWHSAARLLAPNSS